MRPVKTQWVVSLILIILKKNHHHGVHIFKKTKQNKYDMLGQELYRAVVTKINGPLTLINRTFSRPHNLVIN